MNKFLETHEKMTTGIISVFDRIIFKGYLPFCYPAAAEVFLSRQKVLIKDFRTYTKTHTEMLKKHAEKVADKACRPYQYQRNKIRKEDYAREIAMRDSITEGLVCVIARNEENHSFGMRYGTGRPALVKISPQCLTLYFYYMDRHFGLMHIRLSTWLPFSIQVYINGHEWLARQMAAKSIKFEQHENAFTFIENCTRAQKIADKLSLLKWEKILHVFANKVNPLLKTILKGMEYYWVTDQAEYATDVMVRNQTWLSELYKKWQKHSAVCFQAEDIMGFMGRKLHGSFNSTIITDFKKRPSVTRVKHNMRGNWIKMYNKNGIVLRIETVINRPGEFRLFHIGRGKKPGYYAPIRKGVTNMKHYAGIGLRANHSYLDALAQVGDPITVYRELKRIAEPVIRKGVRTRALNPWRDVDRTLFEAVIRGEYHLHGFKSSDIGKRIGIRYSDNPIERKRQCAKVNRKIKLLREHGLVVKYGRSRRYRVTDVGARYMNAAIDLFHNTLPEMLDKAA